MIRNRSLRLALICAATLTLAGCATIFPQPKGIKAGDDPFWKERLRAEYRVEGGTQTEAEQRATIWDLFSNKNNDASANVNRYLWNASLDVLNFLPIETVDPFTGVIVTGFGTPPGGRTAYRATIYISDPSLDARSLKVALQTRGGGAVSAATVAQVEDAILSRARQLRTRDSRL